MKNSRKALAASRDAAAALDDTIARLTDLEQRRVEELPGLHAGLVELYKQGRGGYARMLLNARDLKEIGRAVRTVAGLARINQERAEGTSARSKRWRKNVRRAIEIARRSRQLKPQRSVPGERRSVRSAPGWTSSRRSIAAATSRRSW